MKNYAPYWRRVVRDLLGRRAAWPTMLLEVSDERADVVVLERPPELPKPNRDHVWVKDDQHDRAYQMNVPQMARALLLHT